MWKQKTSIFLIMFSFICILVLSGCCKKKLGTEEAHKAYKEGDFKTAASIYLPEAEKGNPDALVSMAFMYYCGMHDKKDHIKAANYYLEAANKNNVTAQFSLGTMYENGEGLDRSLSEAYFWYLLAEKQNDLDARKLRREAEQRLSSSIVKEIRRRANDWSPIN